MGYKIVDPALLAAGPGPHPAASPFDKRVSEALGITAFEVYKIELPPAAATVRHDHLDDGVEDVYFIVTGHGWVVVDDEELRSGQGSSWQWRSTRHGRFGPATAASPSSRSAARHAE